MATKLGDFFRNTMGVPAGKQPTEKPLIKPAEIPLTPPPPLLVPAPMPVQSPPALSQHAILPELGSQTPKLSSPSKSIEQPAPNLLQPTDPVFQGPPKLTSPGPSQEFQAPPNLLQPVDPVFQDPPNLLQPVDPVFQGPPNLLQPTAPKTQDPPNLLQPVPPVFEPPPALLQPTPPVFEPPPNLLQPTPPVFQEPPALLQPVQVPFEPPPNLLKPTDPVFQGPPALLAPTPPGTQDPPNLLKPVDPLFQGPPNLSQTGSVAFQNPPMLLKPAPVNDVGGSAWYELGNIGELWANAAKRQVAYFKEDLPRMISNLGQKALPTPGKIDPDLLPSTIVTKALNVANAKIQELENTYGYNQIANAGAKVSGFLGSAMGVNYRPDGAFETNSNAISLRKINKEFRKDTSKNMNSLFSDVNNKKLLKSKYKEKIADDDKYWKSMHQTNSYRVSFDTNDGLLSKEVKVKDAARMTYLPFYLVDLRPDASKNFRTVFFQPIDLQLHENFNPSWSKQNFIGRVDPVATYQNTTRTISISFRMVALHPADLEVIYGKLKWLTSMTYPEYASTLRYKSGPVARLRVGNVINAEAKNVSKLTETPGVTGIIENLDVEYDNLWEVEDNWQVPRAVNISFTFTVLHELPIGVIDGEFGGLGEIRSNGLYYSPQELMDLGTQTIIGDDGNEQQDIPPAYNFVNENAFRSMGDPVQVGIGDIEIKKPPVEIGEIKMTKLDGTPM